MLTRYPDARSASLTTWTTHLTTLEARASEHERYANDLIGKIAEPLKQMASRFEELRKRHAEYAEKLERERDAAYADLRKVKAKYDAACQEVEAKRKKAESAFDKNKAQSAFQQQILEMNNVKNTYLISINVTNKHKEKYYHEYLPELMDSLQDLSELRTHKLNGLWTLASQMESAMLQQSVAQVDNLTQEIQRNLPHLDSMMYIRHNMGSFQEPPDKVFEPSPIWHDDESMIVDEAAKIYLRNMLNKSKSQLGELRREADKKRREVEALKRTKQKVRGGEEDKDEIALIWQIFGIQEELHQIDRKRLTAEVETTTITSAVGDVTIGAKNHNFKAQTFKIPTNCDLCGERIWGLSAKGFDCRDCGYTCHSKCEMKVPADCPGELSKDERKKLKQERQEAANKLLMPPSGPPEHIAELPGSELSRSDTVSSRVSGYAPSVQQSEETAPEVPTSTRPTSTTSSSTGVKRNRIVAPPPTHYISELPGSLPNGSPQQEQQKAKMLYHFEAAGPGELTVPEGRELVILEPDNGSGWVKVRAGYKEGLVPASYIEILPSSGPTSTGLAPQHTGQSTFSTNSGSSVGGASISTTTTTAKKKGPAVAPRRGAKKLRYVEALYDYTAQSDAEHSMVEGERFVLVKDDPGDGWVEVEKGGAVKSVPASYVQLVQQ